MDSIPRERFRRIDRKRVHLQNIIAVGIVFIINRFPLRFGSLQRRFSLDLCENVVVDSVARELSLTRYVTVARSCKVEVVTGVVEKTRDVGSLYERRVVCGGKVGYVDAFCSLRWSGDVLWEGVDGYP